MTAVRPRLLLVEDDRATYTALKGILTLRGWDVRVATTLEEARGAMSSDVDAVILDLMLPDGNGESLLEPLREMCGNCPIAVATGVSDAGRLDALQKLGATALLKKPITLADLLKVITPMA